MALPDGGLVLGPSVGAGPDEPAASPAGGRRQTVEQALQRGHIAALDEALARQGDHEDDQLSFVAALRIAVPAGLGIWALIIWAAIRFLS